MQEGGGKYSQLRDTRRAEGITSLSGEAASAGDSHDLEARCCTTPSPLDAPQTLLDLHAGQGAVVSTTSTSTHRTTGLHYIGYCCVKT